MNRIVLLGALLLLAGSAAGHAVPMDSNPAQGDRLPAAPEDAWIRFTEPLHAAGSYVRIVGADGSRWEANQTIEGTDTPAIHVDAMTGMADGAYRLQWQTHSASDGHTITGSIGFAVGDAVAPEGEVGEATNLGLAAARIFVHAGIAIGLGLAAMRRLVDPAPQPWDRKLRLAGAASFALGITAWGAATALATGTTASLSDDPIWIIRAVIAAALFAPMRKASAAIWLAAALATAWSGHATSHGWFAMGNEWLHLASAGAWSGALIPLWLQLRQQPDRVGPLGARFGKMAMVLVAAAVATGVGATWLILGERLATTNWLTTTWGTSLIAKVCLVAIMVAAAAVNRRRILATLKGKHAAGHFVLGEAITGAAILLVAALLLSTSPTAVPAASGAEPDLGLHIVGEGTVMTAHGWITPTPMAGTIHAVRLQINHGDSPVINDTCGRANCATFRWQPVGDANSSQQVPLQSDGDAWIANNVLLPAAGNYEWIIRMQTATVYADSIQGNFTAT